MPSSPRPVEIGPSTHYAHPPASTRAVRDEPLVPVAAQLREDIDGVYGVHKMHPALASKGGLDELIAPLVTDLAPQLLGRCGTGIEVAGQLVVIAGENRARLRSEASFARHCIPSATC